MDTELWAEEERRDMKLFCRYFCFLFGFVCLFVYAGPGTLTTEPVYRDVAGSETAGLSTYNAFPVCEQSHTGDIWLAMQQRAPGFIFASPRGPQDPRS